MHAHLSIDRFEGETAVLVGEANGSIDFPLSLLPEGSKPGDVLSFVIERDLAATKELQDDTKRIQDELRKRDPGGDLDL